MENLTPMLSQYRKIKSQYKDYILFFRLGDFYEMFFDDAKVASQILEVVLTSRTAGKLGRIPMCGIPYHALEHYAGKLVRNGFKIAVCEQVEDPKTAKGLVERQVVRIITPGTVILDGESDVSERRLCVISKGKKGLLNVVVLDLVRGRISIGLYSKQEFLEKLPILGVKELVCPQEDAFIQKVVDNMLVSNLGILVSNFPDWKFSEKLNEEIAKKVGQISYVNQMGFDESMLGCIYAGISYIEEMLKEEVSFNQGIGLLDERDSVYIQPSAIVGLGIDKLYRHLDKCMTAMGRRLLRDWVYNPCVDINEIERRQLVVERFVVDNTLRQSLRKALSNVLDIEKLTSRVVYRCFRIKDLVALRNGLVEVRRIREEFRDVFDEKIPLDDLMEITDYLEKALVGELPEKIEGNLFRDGFCPEIDEIRKIYQSAEKFLSDLREKEAKKTGIVSLKIGYNRVFGYYFEVTKSNLHLVPKYFIRKQTLTNAERFITEELKDFEERMISAQDRLISLEAEKIKEVVEKIKKNSASIYKIARQIARIDCLLCLSEVAARFRYCKPKITFGDRIEIRLGRHPFVETEVDNFVPNDVSLDRGENSFLLITGPNMAGKSTYIRQVALIVIMAQMGSFVPAESAEIGLVDKIFARIGGEDEITKGYSTFMVEMSQTAVILNTATERSLVVLDEIGRGTSTYDGLSLAWAVVEFLAQKRIRSLFATHFHELTQLEEWFDGVKNYNVEVKEWNDEVIFLHSIVRGAADRSYGIYVAQLAGVPEGVIQRAKEILADLEGKSVHRKVRRSKKNEQQVLLFEDKREKVLDEIRRVDVNNLTPVEAINLVDKWKKFLG